MKQIAITTRVDEVAGIDERRDGLSQEWMALFEACDFVPLILPNHQRMVEKIVQNAAIDGILLTGGNDLVRYGGTAPERDAVERYLVAYAKAQGIPLLGVCRGMQVILDTEGVALHPVANHARVLHPLQNSARQVNSYHHWGAYQGGALFEVVALSEDGVVEALKHKVANIQGIMWHPERNHPFHQEDIDYLKEVFR